MGKGLRTRGRRTQPKLAAGFGERLRAARERASLSQSEVGEPRYGRGYISALEHERHRPSLAALQYMSERLGTSLAELLGGTGEPVECVEQVSRALALIRDAGRTSVEGEARMALIAAEFTVRHALEVLAQRRSTDPTDINS